MKLPSDLIQKMQGDYVSLKYKDGVFTFPSVDEETLSVFVKSFIEWAYMNKYVDDDDKLDISKMKEW